SLAVGLHRRAAPRGVDRDRRRSRHRRHDALGVTLRVVFEYFDNPEANEASFEDGWFKTGDVVRIGEGGNVFYQERDKDLLKVGGENVSAREVEERIGTVAGVAQV